ncbi:MAG: nitrophenyl compound nitroreductase subunit ArsF family protein [Candidatus Zixiibacteriota bacterium]
MTPKKIATFALLLLVAASILVFAGRQMGWLSAGSETSLGRSSRTEHRIIAYYFHGNVRCQTCLTIEAYIDETLKSRFAEPMENGKLEWRVINREVEPNTHFVDDYQLYSQALIIVDSADGRVSEWKSLDDIWKYVDDKPAFMHYVNAEVSEYLRRL